MTTSPLSITPPSPEIFSTTSVATEGFGEYQKFAPKNFEGYQTTQKVHLLIQTLLLGIATIAIVVGAVILSAPLWAVPLALLPIAILSVRAFLNHKAQSSYFPPNLTEGLNPKDFQGKQVGEYIQDNGLGVVLNDAVESKQYKLDLIRNAQQSIFLSCYMGEEALDEALDLIKERMQQNAILKVFILTSDHFLTDENRKRVEALKALYPDRFHTVFNPEIYYSEHPSGEGRRLLSTNHIKLMTIDQGNYMVIGGCALRPFWTDVTGEEHLQKLEQTGFDFQNPLEAKGFRDMDFAFKSEHRGAGMTSFLEGAKLMLRYAHMQSPQYAQTLKQQFLELMQLPKVESQVGSIDENLQQVSGLGMKLYSTGPDHTSNSYLDALIGLIDNAQEKIVIAHMYFHPPQSLINALLRAAQRGINIKIVSNTTESEAPLAHKFFHPLAQETRRQLSQAQGRQNIHMHEFYRANTTYHKKVIVVDDKYTAFGSSNLGLKSLDPNPSDYEFNAVLSSPEFAERTMRVLERDIELSRPVSIEKARDLPCKTRFSAWIQEQTISHIL